MTPTDRLPFAQWAEVLRNERFFCIEPLSGYRRTLPEDEGYVVYLEPNATDEELGRALLECVDRSRFIWPPDERSFFKADRIMRCYENREQDLMRRYGYETKDEAYRAMDWCRAKRSEGKISIQPHKREKPEYWNDHPPDMTVVISSTTDAAAVGAALRLAFDRCG